MLTNSLEAAAAVRSAAPRPPAGDPRPGVRKAYGAVQALDGVDLTVRRGELLALLGPNGAGKTTLLEILEGHRRADAGEVSVLGHDPALRERALRERIGIVLQEEGLDPNLNVGEAVELYGAAYPAPRPVARCSSSSGSADRAGARAASLSGGQRRRLDLALGIAGDPELIFLDEPTTGFDPGARRHSWELIEPPARARQDDPADHALHGGGAGAGRPRRRARGRPGDRRGHARTRLPRAAGEAIVSYRLGGARRALPHRHARPPTCCRCCARPRPAARSSRG